MKILYCFNLKSQKLSIAGLFHLLLLVGCSDEPDFSAPLIQTGFVNNVNEQGAQVNGLVTYKGKGNSIVGFVWGTANNPVTETSSKVILEQFSEGPISFDITFDLLENQTYYVRAFGQSGNEIVYGDEVSFESSGSLGPSIENFMPATGKRGNTFQVNGNNFSGQALNVFAKLGGIEVEVLQANPNQLTLRIPDNFNLSGKVKLSVKVAGREAISNDFFTLDGAIISDFLPKNVIGGDTFKIHGDNFDSILINNKVSLNSSPCEVLSATRNQLLVRVPHNQSEGLYALHVAIQNITTQSIDKITIRSPWTTHNYSNTSPILREDATIFVISDEIYYGTGLNRNFYPDDNAANRNDFWKFSPSSNRWTKLADFPGEPRSDASGFVIDNLGYVAMGNKSGGTYFTDLWQYNPTTNSWARKSDHPVVRYTDYLCFSLKGKAYLGLGGELGVYRDFWEYDPLTDQWTQLGDFPGTLRGRFTKFISNDKAYLGLGISSSASFLKDIWEYDPDIDEWTRKSDFPGSLRTYVTGTSNNSKAFLFGGWSASGSFLRESWEYDMKSDIWVKRPDLPRNVNIGTAPINVNETIFLLGGRDHYNYFTYFLTYNSK